MVVRFAPSPTGALHVGGVRTALYNYLLAKKHKGTFILRIEDTDQTRFVPGAEEYIIESLKWCGILPDEGTHNGGKHAPYRQSERSALYQQYAEQLVKSGNAYYAFDTAEELNQHRAAAKEAGNGNWTYNIATRKGLNNSLSLSEDVVKAKLAAGEDYVIRFLIPENEEVTFVDDIKGSVTFQSAQLDDKVLMKSDGLPTYHLANVVDDHLMEVTNVIRGDEWLGSAPLHVLLYRAFGWERPHFAHLPLILRPDGNGKLSKRDGDRLGIPVFSLDWTDPHTGEKSSGFREAGYLPAALINFLALLGWSPGHDEEVMTLERMTDLFSIEKVGKSGTKFDLDKLKWFNQTYIKAAYDSELIPLIRQTIEKEGLSNDLYSDAYLSGVIALMKERVVVTHDFVTKAKYFYLSPEYDAAFMAKQWHDAGKANIKGLIPVWAAVSEDNWNIEELQTVLTAYMQENSIGNGKILPQLRLAITGVSGGPESVAVAALLGKVETLKRLEGIFLVTI